MAEIVFSVAFGIVVNETWAYSKMLLQGERPLAGYVQNARRIVPLHQSINERFHHPVAYWDEFYRSVYGFDEKHFEERGFFQLVGAPWCSIVYYTNRYPDLGSLASEPLVHMFSTGLREGRQLSPHFDPVYYMENEPDLKAAFGGIQDPTERNGALLQHYVHFGCSEGRTASRDCCVKGYLKRYPEVASRVNNDFKQGLIHFYKYGNGAGLSCAPMDICMPSPALFTSICPALALLLAPSPSRISQIKGRDRDFSLTLLMSFVPQQTSRLRETDQSHGRECQRSSMQLQAALQYACELLLRHQGFNGLELQEQRRRK
jgi:hypothetical protein